MAIGTQKGLVQHTYLHCKHLYPDFSREKEHLVVLAGQEQYFEVLINLEVTQGVNTVDQHRNIDCNVLQKQNRF